MTIQRIRVRHFLLQFFIVCIFNCYVGSVIYIGIFALDSQKYWLTSCQHNYIFSTPFGGEFNEVMISLISYVSWVLTNIMTETFCWLLEMQQKPQILYNGLAKFWGDNYLIIYTQDWELN
jgi:hypothetical protein